MILLSIRRSKIRQSRKNVDNTLLPVSSMESRLCNFYPREMTPPTFYKEFTKTNNMSIGQKYAKLAHKCLDQLSKEVSKNSIIYNNQTIEESVQKCIGDLSCLWHVLDGQFSLTDETSSLIYEVRNKRKREIQAASKYLYKNAKLLGKHKNELDNKLSNLVKSVK